MIMFLERWEVKPWVRFCPQQKCIYLIIIIIILPERESILYLYQFIYLFLLATFVQGNLQKYYT